MNAKDRYRLRQKLQAALLRVVEVIGELEEEGVVSNVTNLVTADAVMKVLARYLHRDIDPTKDDEPLMVRVDAIEALKHAKKRQLIETAKRKIRKKRSRRR